MKAHVLVVGLAALIAGTAHAAELSADQAAVGVLEAQSWVAWQNHDAAFFEQFLSDDHVEIHGYGVVGKAAVVEGVRSPFCKVQSYVLGPLTVTVLSPDSMLVTYRAEQVTTCGTARVPSPVWASSVYARRGGRWVNVLYQHTPVTPS